MNRMTRVNKQYSAIEFNQDVRIVLDGVDVIAKRRIGERFWGVIVKLDDDEDDDDDEEEAVVAVFFF